MEGAHFKVHSDHKSLMELATQPKLSNCQTWWVEFLQGVRLSGGPCPWRAQPGRCLVWVARSASDNHRRRAVTRVQGSCPLISATVHGVHLVCAVRQARVTPADGPFSASAHPCGGFETSCANSHKLRSQPTVGSRQPASPSRPPGTGVPCARGEKLGSRQPQGPKACPLLSLRRSRDFVCSKRKAEVFRRQDLPVHPQGLCTVWEARNFVRLQPNAKT